MRTLGLTTALIATLACGESDKGDDQPSDPAEAKAGASGDSKAAKAGDAKAATERPAPKPSGDLECAPWVAEDLVKTHCGVDAGPWTDDGFTKTAITCGRSVKQGRSRIEVSFSKLFNKLAPVHRRKFPDPPKLEAGHSNRKTIKGRAFPYLLTVASSGEPLCTDEQLMALTKAVLAKVPSREEPASKENRACDALLTAADVKAKCGNEATVRASGMEDGKTLYCNRGGPSGLIFIVSKHASDDLAKRGADVAHQDAAAGVAHKGPYSIELKLSSGSKVCNKAGLDALAAMVAERL